MSLACNGSTTDQNGMSRPRVAGMPCTSGSVEVAFAPEIVVEGPGPVGIANGGSYHLGSTIIGTPLNRTITVRNIGAVALNLLTNPPTVSAGFTAGNFGATTVTAGGSTTFTLTCTGAALGSPVSGTVSFNNDDADESPFIFTVTCTVNNSPPPAAPSGLTATAPNQTQINLSWADNSSDETSFHVERSLDGSTGWTPYVLVGANVTSYQDTWLDCGTAYYYRVRAFRSSDSAYSNYSNTASTTTLACSLGSPMPTAPENESLTNNNRPVFSWAAVTGAAMYHMQIDDNDDFGSPKDGYLGNGLSYTPETLVDGTTYFWRVRSLGSGYEASPWSGAWTVSIDQARLAAPKLTAPVSGSSVAVVTPSFTWSAVTGATQYQLQIDDEPNFFPPSFTRNLGKVTSYKAVVADGLHYGTTYYWRLRAGDAAGIWSDWSLIRSFTLTIHKTPTNGAYSTNVKPTFTWAAVTGGTWYELQVANNPDFATGHLVATYSGTAKTYTIPSASPLGYGQYWWRVRVTTGTGVSPWMRPWTLTVTTTLPAAPGPITPEANALTGDNTPIFTWNPTPTTAGSPFAYQLQIDTISTFLHPEQDVRQAGLTYTATALPDGKYYWRVRAINNVDAAGSWSTSRSFTVDTTPPAAPKLLTPADWSGTTNTRPTFKWATVTGAKYYTLDIYTANCATHYLTIERRTTTSYTLAAAEALPYGNLCWRVKAGDAAENWGVSSANFHLAVSATAIPKPGTPVLGTPENGTFWTSATLPVFTWTLPGGAGNDVYQIQIDNNSNFASPEQETTTAVDQLTYTAGPLADAKYYWRVRTIHAWGVSGAWSAARFFTLDNVPPAAPVLTAPANTTSTTSTRPTLTWKSVTGTQQYLVQVDEAPGFGSPFVNTIRTTTSYTLTAGEALNYGTTYAWRAQAQDAAGNTSPWSEAQFTATVMKAPADGSAATNTKPTFTWQAVTGANYVLQVANSPGFAPETIMATYTGTGTSYTIPSASPLAYGTYYWHVQVNGVLMPTWILRVTPNLPGIPTLSTPAANALSGDNTPTFTWTSATNGQTYQIQIDDLSTFASPNQDVTGGVGVLSYTANTLPNGKYYWRVRAINSYGAAGKWSSPRAITIDVAVPDVPIMTGPANGTTITNPQITLRWNKVTDAASYEVRLDTLNPPATPSISTGTALTYKPSVPLSRGTFYWQVRALDAAGNPSAWSDAWSFIVVAGVTSIEKTPLPAEEPTVVSDTTLEATGEPTFEPTTLPAVTPPAEETAAVEPTAEITLEPTATPTATLLPPVVVPPGVTPLTIESDDPAVQQLGSWTAHDTLYASGGRYLYSSGSLEDTLTLAFTGSRIDVIYVKHPALGVFVIEIDGVPVQVVDSIAPDSEFGARATVAVGAGQHTLRIYPLTGTIAIDAFSIEPLVVATVEPTLPPVETVIASTPESTVEPTLPSVTAEPTLTPTPLPTDVPILVVLPFADSFDSGSDWTISGGWSLQPAYTGSGWWADCTARGQVSTLTYNGLIDLRTAQYPQASFWQKGSLSSADVLSVEVSLDGVLWWSALRQSDLATDWVRQTVDLSAYRGNVIGLRFVLNTTTALPQGAVSAGFGLDDLLIQDMPPTPTIVPTLPPTAVPTELPTTEPTVIPTEVPEPTAVPTEPPTAEPTIEPTPEPTIVPTVVPTEPPTAEPTVEPTPIPTEVEQTAT